MNIFRKTLATLLFINLNRLSPINIETYHMLHMMRTIIPLYSSIQTGYNMHLTQNTIEFLQVKWICGHKIASLFVLTYIYHASKQSCKTKWGFIFNQFSITNSLLVWKLLFDELLWKLVEHVMHIFGSNTSLLAIRILWYWRYGLTVIIVSGQICGV